MQEVTGAIIDLTPILITVVGLCLIAASFWYDLPHAYRHLL